MKNFCILVPFRKREAQLQKFVPYYKSIFPQVDICVVEQSVEKPFNRGAILNSAFVEFGKNYLYAAYHDIDLFVSRSYCDYSFPKNPTHLATHCSQFKWEMPYEEYFGGVILLSTEQMIDINGFSNEFYGRGEDDEMRRNILDSEYEIDSRDNFYISLPHKESGLDTNHSVLNNGRGEKDGLTHCKYEVLSREEKDGYFHIKVKL